MSIPQVDIKRLKNAIATAEANSRLKNWETLCMKVAQSNWAAEEGLDSEEVGELILHYGIETKTLKPGEPEPAPNIVEKMTPVPILPVEKISSKPDKAILDGLPVVVMEDKGSVVKTQESGGKGKKQCPTCLKYMGVRTQVCVCGYCFSKKEPVQTPAPTAVPMVTAPIHATVAATATDEEATDPRFADRRGGCRTTIHTPAGECPVRLKGYDEDSIRHWADQVRSGFRSRSEFLKLRGLRYYLRYFYEINSPEFNEAKQHLLDLHPGEDFN